VLEQAEIGADSDPRAAEALEITTPGSDRRAAAPTEAAQEQAEPVPADSVWVSPRLYDAETETLTPEAFLLLGSACIEEAKQRRVPLTLLLVALSADDESDAAHAAGAPDEQARALAGVLLGSLHNGDLVARQQGRSFAVLLHGAAAQAVHIANWIKLVVGQWPPCRSGRPVLISQGIAELDPEADFRALVIRAQATLAWAIQDGGSSIRVYGAPRAGPVTTRALAIQDRRPDVGLTDTRAPARRPAKKHGRPVVRTVHCGPMSGPACLTSQQISGKTVTANLVAGRGGGSYRVTVRIGMAIESPGVGRRARRR
jgi:GGDEF domain-containing protein